MYLNLKNVREKTRKMFKAYLFEDKLHSSIKQHHFNDQSISTYCISNEHVV